MFSPVKAHFTSELLLAFFDILISKLHLELHGCVNIVTKFELSTFFLRRVKHIGEA